MGQTPDQIEEQIHELRHETDVIVDELAHRLSPRNLIHEATSTITGNVASVVEEAEAVVTEMPETVRHNQPLFGAAGLAAVAGLGLFALSTALLGARSAAVEQEFDQTVERAGRRLETAEELDEALARAVEQLKKTHYPRISVERREPGMLKRLMWVAMASAMAALGSMLFKRVTAGLWRGAMHEEPPKS